MSDDARGHRGRHSGRVHGRVFPLPIVPSVIYGSTLSYRAIHLLIVDVQNLYLGFHPMLLLDSELP